MGDKPWKPYSRHPNSLPNRPKIKVADHFKPLQPGKKEPRPIRTQVQLGKATTTGKREYGNSK